MLPGWPLLLILQIAPVAKATPTLPQASVLMVRGHMGGDRYRSGSGVVIAPHLVATNAHVVEGTQGLTVQQGGKSWPVSGTRMEPNHDLCLLTVPGLLAPTASLAPEPMEPGQKVLAIGYPGGRGPVLSMGRLRGVWHLGNGRLLQSDAAISPGSSGGGLFDEQGRLLGITTQTLTKSARMNFSISAAWIQEMATDPHWEDVWHPDWSLRERSADLLEQLAKDPRNMASWGIAARQWVLDFPKDEDAWMALGMSLDHSIRSSASSDPERLQEAVEAYRHSLALHGEAKTWNNLGADLDLLNRFDEAERAFGEALILDPAYALAWLNLGCTRMNAGRHAPAAVAFQKGLALRPDEANAWVRLAHCHRKLGQREMAVATMQIALRYRPLAAELWLDFGLMLVDLASLEEAREVHRKLMSLDPERAARLKASLNRLESIHGSKAVGAKGSKSTKE